MRASSINAPDNVVQCRRSTAKACSNIWCRFVAFLTSCIQYSDAIRVSLLSNMTGGGDVTRDQLQHEQPSLPSAFPCLAVDIR